MVEKIRKEGRTFFQCEKCNLKYKGKEWAERCEDWCKKYNSCNIEITRHSEERNGI